MVTQVAIQRGKLTTPGIVVLFRRIEPPRLEPNSCPNTPSQYVCRCDRAILEPSIAAPAASLRINEIWTFHFPVAPYGLGGDLEWDGYLDRVDRVPVLQRWKYAGHSSIISRVFGRTRGQYNDAGYTQVLGVDKAADNAKPLASSLGHLEYLPCKVTRSIRRYAWYSMYLAIMLRGA